MLFIACVLLLNSCSKETYEIQNLNNNTIDVLGHGGMGIGKTLPMNSLESLLTCMNTGATGTELDLQMTKDSVLIAFHDLTLDTKTNRSGNVYDYTWEELKGTIYSQTLYQNYALVSLEEILENLASSTTFKLTFDCKLYGESTPPSYRKTFASSLVKAIHAYTISDRVAIEAQDVSFLKEIQALDSNLKTYIYPPTFEEGFQLAQQEGFSGITISTTKISKEQIQQAHDAGLLVSIWNTHSKKDNRDAVLKNPDCIQTEKVRYLLKLLE